MTDAALPVTIAQAASGPQQNPTLRALQTLFERPSAVIGLAVIALFVILAVFAPLIAPYDPIATSWSMVRKAPSAAHWFGTLGRDILSRVIYGTRASLLAGVIS